MYRFSLIGILAISFAGLWASPALAGNDSGDEFKKQAEFVRLHPTDYEAAYKYARDAIDRHD